MVLLDKSHPWTIVSLDNSLLGQLSTWTKSPLENCLLGQSPLGQLLQHLVFMYSVNISLGAGCLHHIAIYNVNQIIYHSSKVFPESCPYLL